MRRSRTLTAALVFALAGTATAACSGAKGDATDGKSGGGTALTVARPLDVIDISPDGSFLRASDSQIVALYADSLYQVTPEFTIEPALAAAMPTVSADELSWTIPLRPDVSFSNGSPVTAADVKFSLEHAKQGQQQGKLFAAISTVDTPDPHTVVIHTAQKNAPFLWVLASFQAAILPHDFAGMAEKDFFQKPIGAGAYTIAERKPGTSIKLVANPSYYGTKPKVSSITFVPVADSNTRLLKLRSGSVDLIEDPPTAQVAQLAKDSSVKVVARPVGVMRLGLNTAKAPLNDLHFRRAVSLAINRESIVKAALAGRGTVACNWVSTTFLRGYQTPFGCLTDADKAKAELAMSATPTGASFTLIYDSADPQMPLTAQVIQSDLAKIGVQVKLNGTTNQVYKAALTDKTFEGRFSLFALAGDPSLSINNYLNTTAEGTQAPILPQVKTAYQAATQLFDEDQRFKAYDQIMDQIAEDADAVALYSPEKLWATSANVTDAKILPTNKLNFADISIAP